MNDLSIAVLWPYKPGVWFVSCTQSLGWGRACHWTRHLQLTKFPKKFRGQKRCKNLRKLVLREEWKMV